MLDYMHEWGSSVIYDATKIEVEVIEGFVDDIKPGPELPAECWNDAAIDVVKAWKAVEDLCRGNG